MTCAEYCLVNESMAGPLSINTRRAVIAGRVCPVRIVDLIGPALSTEWRLLMSKS
jgi:hypothetical protein